MHEYLFWEHISLVYIGVNADNTLRVIVMIKQYNYKNSFLSFSPVRTIVTKSVLRCVNNCLKLKQNEWCQKTPEISVTIKIILLFF